MNLHPTPRGADGPQLTMIQETIPAFTPPFGWDVRSKNGGALPVARNPEQAEPQPDTLKSALTKLTTASQTFFKLLVETLVLPLADRLQHRK